MVCSERDTQEVVEIFDITPLPSISDTGGRSNHLPDHDGAFREDRVAVMRYVEDQHKPLKFLLPCGAPCKVLVECVPFEIFPLSRRGCRRRSSRAPGQRQPKRGGSSVVLMEDYGLAVGDRHGVSSTASARWIRGRRPGWTVRQERGAGVRPRRPPRSTAIVPVRNGNRRAGPSRAPRSHANCHAPLPRRLLTWCEAARNCLEYAPAVRLRLPGWCMDRGCHVIPMHDGLEIPSS